MYQPKGSPQVSFERGWVDPTKFSEYSNDGNKYQLDENGPILPEYCKYSLCHILTLWKDFQIETTAIQQLMTTLRYVSTQNISLEIIPK